VLPGQIGGRFVTTINTNGTWLNRALRSKDCDSNSIRAVIADQLGVEVEHITDQTHLARDLGADWLDRLDLVILIEGWTGLEFDDDDLEEINLVGDLIRLFESAKEQRDRLN